MHTDINSKNTSGQLICPDPVLGEQSVLLTTVKAHINYGLNESCNRHNRDKVQLK